MFDRIKKRLSLHNFALIAIFGLGLLTTACGETPSPTSAPVSTPAPTQVKIMPIGQPTIEAGSTPVVTGLFDSFPTNRPAGNTPTPFPAQPTSTAPASAPTTKIMPIGQPTMVIDSTPVALGVAEPALKATGFDAANAKALLDELTQQVGVRVYAQESERKAANWIENKFRSWGYTQVEQQKISPPQPAASGQTVPVAPKTSQNVVAIRPANHADAPILIFGGHYDTVAATVGASDNGSGTVLTLEVSRVLFQKYPDYELRFVTFGGEEVGLFGSRYYSGQLTPNEKQRIKAFINLDALGVGDRFVAVGTPELVTLAVNTARSNGVRLEPFDLSTTPNSSDHASFIANGVKSVALLRWIDPLLHKAGDVSARVYPETLLLGGGTALLLTEQLVKAGA